MGTVNSCVNSEENMQKCKEEKSKQTESSPAVETRPSKETSEQLPPKEETDESIVKNRGYFLFPGHHIGKGTYAQVKKGISKELEQDVAIKVINQKVAPKEYCTKFLPREIKISYLCHHPNIIRCHDIFKHGSKIFMVLEYAKEGDLLQYVLSERYIMEHLAKRMFRGILSAVRYLHFNGIVHRDLKCENILLDGGLVPKLTDFGFAKQSYAPEQFDKTFCGSAAYASFEILSGIPYNGYKTDVWSLGVILYIMVTGTMPFDENLGAAGMLACMRNGIAFTKSKQFLSEQVKDLIKGMLKCEPDERPTIEEVCKDKWVRPSKVSIY